MPETLRLSDAIRLGAMLKPQGFGSWQGVDGKSSCALQAAVEAVGKHMDDLLGIWPALRPYPQRFVKCPACKNVLVARDIAIAHINDVHRWTRERIADYVEATFEQEAAPECSAPVAAEVLQP